MKPKWKRPQNCPREITSAWPGITYPDEHGCQARITMGTDRSSKYFSYSEFDGDAVAAHRAAMSWVLKLAKKCRRTGAEATKLRARHEQWLAGGGARVLAAGG